MKAIETVNLTYTYPDGTKALDDINFSVEKGENIAILGPNGAENPLFFTTLTVYT